uniref:Uncharacterized protein n=1 Tax=Mastacembelus armatus TaxID=205130 RepID=A0A3Q3KLG2_9TELE
RHWWRNRQCLESHIHILVDVNVLLFKTLQTHIFKQHITEGKGHVLDMESFLKGSVYLLKESTPTHKLSLWPSSVGRWQPSVTIYQQTLRPLETFFHGPPDTTAVNSCLILYILPSLAASSAFVSVSPTLCVYLCLTRSVCYNHFSVSCCDI